jgi:hypothetical protein
MEMSSTERALTTKSLCQWTAATTLFAVGSLAFLSANTIEKLSEQGDVALDLEAFRRLGSISVALDRTEEQRLLLEEDRLVEKASFAQAEALPKPSLKFSKNIGVAKLRKKTRNIAKSRVNTAPIEVMTATERAEIAALEKAPDPARESAALAGIYRRVRFQFVAAVDSAATREALIAETEGYDSDRREYGEESVEVAQESEAYEYDEMPSYDGSDFVLPADRRSDSMLAGLPPTTPTNSGIETAPAAIETVRDEIESTASATANPEIFSVDPLPPAAPEANALVDAEKDSSKTALITPIITSNGLDEVPSADFVTTQVEKPVTSQKGTSEMSTGPPKTDLSEKAPPPASLATSPAQSTPSLASISEKPHSPSSEISVTAEELLPPAAEDIAEYAADLGAAYQSSASGTDGSESDYSEDGEYSARPGRMQSKGVVADETPIVASSTLMQRSTAQKSANKDYGNGVSKDKSGITIDWHQRPIASIQVRRPTESIAYVPPSKSKPEIQESLDKFSFSAPVANTLAPSAGSAPESEPVQGKCDTEKLGVEAFNPSAEKETLSVCRRSLSLEGAANAESPRWWEAYGTESAHWPTLIYQRSAEAKQEKSRIPMLSIASIRILSTISRVNTHTGMGIIFGEIPRGLEIRLVGRSDAPIYLDGGMNVRDVSDDPTAKRQFVFLNVAPGQPFLAVTDTTKKSSGAIPLIVKAGIATYIRVPELTEKDASFVIYDASSATEKRLSGVTAEIVGQTGRIGISDKKGVLKIQKIATFGEYPLYLDLVRNTKSYKNRYRLAPSDTNRAFLFFDERRANDWISQLAGGVSPYSGMIVGMVPKSTLSPKDPAKSSHLRIGTFEKKSSLVPERYLIDGSDRLVSESKVRSGLSRFVAVQVPEGVAIPSVIDAQGELLWSEIVYAQPGVINIVGP